MLLNDFLDKLNQLDIKLLYFHINNDKLFIQFFSKEEKLLDVKFFNLKNNQIIDLRNLKFQIKEFKISSKFNIKLLLNNCNTLKFFQNKGKIDIDSNNMIKNVIINNNIDNINLTRIKDKILNLKIDSEVTKKISLKKFTNLKTLNLFNFKVLELPEVKKLGEVNLNYCLGLYNDFNIEKINNIKLFDSKGFDNMFEHTKNQITIETYIDNNKELLFENIISVSLKDLTLKKLQCNNIRNLSIKEIRNIETLDVNNVEILSISNIYNIKNCNIKNIDKLIIKLPENIDNYDLINKELSNTFEFIIKNYNKIKINRLSFRFRGLKDLDHLFKKFSKNTKKQNLKNLLLKFILENQDFLSSFLNISNFLDKKKTTVKINSI